MFADYRVPQVLHHLRILDYPHVLEVVLQTHKPLASGSPEELSIRAASVVAVERVRQEILAIIAREGTEVSEERVSSVLIDFYLWDLAKKIEGGTDAVHGVRTNEILPPHRTRSIWY